MKYIFLVIIILFFIAFTLRGLLELFMQKDWGWKSNVNRFAGFCLIISALGFFGTAFFSVSDFKTAKFEWPIGITFSAYPHQSGNYIVLHKPSGRLQVYDKSLNYMHGWGINAHTGSFNLVPSDGGTFDIYTARGEMKYRYDISGQLLSSEKHSGQYPSNREHLQALNIPTPFYLWVFTNPFKAWFVGVMAIIMLIVTSRAERKKSQTIG